MGESVDRRIQLETDDTVKIVLLGLAANPPGWNGTMHSHDFWELLVMVKDRSDAQQMVAGGETYMSCEPVTLYLIPPHTEHAYTNPGELTNQNLYIGYEYQSQSEENLPYSFPVVIPTHSSVMFGVAAELKEIARELGVNTPQGLKDRRLEIMSCVLRLVRYLASDGAEDSLGNKTRNKRLIHDVKEYIQNNLDHHIRIDEMAAMFFISPSYLGQMFRRATGMTVKAYHNQMRMEYALKLLKSGKHNISAAAAAIGFFDVTYFSRKFKEYYGLSPSQLVAEEEA